MVYTPIRSVAVCSRERPTVERADSPLAVAVCSFLFGTIFGIMLAVVDRPVGIESRVNLDAGRQDGPDAAVGW